MSESSKSTVMVIDALSMAFRAFFALPVENFTTSSGTPTNAVHGFAAMLVGLLNDRQPTHVAVAFDLPGGTFRTEELPSYKGTRDETPPDFEPQVPLIRELLEALGIVVLDKVGFEADDVVATVAAQATAAGMDVLVVSGDRDTLQLVNDSVTVLYPRRGVSDLVEFTPGEVEAKYQVRPEQYPDLAALVGETSDNLPGVPGVGPKTAAKWINAYGGLEGILSSIDDIPGKAGDSLRSHVDLVVLNRRLNRLVDDLELDAGIDDLQVRGGDADKVHAMCDLLEFRTLRTRLLAFTDAAAQPAGVGESSGALSVHVDGAVAAVIALESPLAVYVDGRIGADADAWAMAVSTGTERWWIDLTALDEHDEQALARWWEDATLTRYLFDAKATDHMLAARGWRLGKTAGDAQLASFLINPDQRGFDIESLAQRYLGANVTERAPDGQFDLGMEDPTSAATVRAQWVWELTDLFHPQLEERAMDSLYHSIEVPLVSVLATMERDGIAVNASLLATQYDEAMARADKAAHAAYESIDGYHVNLGSPKQLQEVLFERLGLPKTKKIKTGYSTDAASLQDLFVHHPHPFLEHLLAHRDATKLAQIIAGLQAAVRSDGRIHTTFSQTVAATGRLSSRDPNLQNIPVRTEAGHRIREAFVAGEGFETLVTADYSQIEMRIMAHLSGDAGLIAAFAAGEDLHRFVGARVFGVEPQDVDSAMRTKVKAMSYGLAYGLSQYGLSRQLGIDVSEAQQLMDEYYQRFGAVRTYLDSVVKRATEVGYTETIFGRRRYVPDLTSDHRQRRDIAQRVALNAPIQGSAADIIKRAMLGVDTELVNRGLSSRQVLQVHDELVVEVAPGELEEVSQILIDQMGGAADLLVPLDVNVGVGANWRAAGH